MADLPEQTYGLTALGMVCALGRTCDEIYANAQASTTAGMRTLGGFLPNGDTTPFGCVPGVVIPTPDMPLSQDLPRCIQLIDLALIELQPALAELTTRLPPQRIGTVLGTSNSTMEEFTACPEHIDMATPALYLRRRLGLEGPAYVISTACSSSAKAFLSARRLLETNVCDAVIIGGVDSFSRVVLNGFYALEALSTRPSRPLAADREGINLGERAALFILERNRGDILLAGVGESSDAHHLTAPDPSGAGARAAMQAALADAHLAPADIDYINLHGTGTRYNDSMECAAIADLFGAQTPLLSSTKPLTGHTLGAAGAIEAGLCWLLLTKHGPAYPHPIAPDELDPTLPPIALATRPTEAAGSQQHLPTTILSNAFAFGGSNATLILRRHPANTEAPAAPRASFTLEEILPHRAPMILISGYDPASYDSETETLRCWVIPSTSDLFYDAQLGGIPPQVAVEYMAQSIAAYVGLNDRLHHRTPRVGLFLGARRITINLPRFEPDRLYYISVHNLFSDDAFAAFQCKVTTPAGNVLIEATLNVFRPEAEALAQFDGDLSTIRPL